MFNSSLPVCRVFLAAALSLFLFTPSVSSQEVAEADVWSLQDYRDIGINFQSGPMNGDLGNAEIKVKSGWAFLGTGDTKKLMELYGNQLTGMERGTLVRADEPDSWFAVFEFDPIGYIADAESEDLDAKAMLKAFKKSDGPANEWRQQNGQAPLNTVGWKTEPFYDPQTNNLEWCLELESEGYPVLNHNIRILGRRGVMQVTLVCDPADLDAALMHVQSALTAFSFKSGESYAEYRSGDKIAKYGLAALVTGGAVAVAAKSGVLSKLIKPIIIGVVVLGGVFAKFFKGLFGGFAKE
ncbi:DUF2167 domain-containing protein [Algisphaera agarilytica]|uniref:Putative membrane-anchored protein n=1 Tax=Algisphaera agarilytica TaxID=1385975 RepID=A0A7X0LLS7_9BACT|nr:DUF2167 domain-containing protein [Algisphaera agarilytica]MBB6431327.1 putative membrane-anchored protein [Algisphaera agarilytica]